MKKKNEYVLGAMMLLMLASCASGDGVLPEPEAGSVEEAVPGVSQSEPEIDEEHLFDNIPDDGESQPIVIRSAEDQVSVTKGTGTAGVNDGKWQYENIYVLMTTSDSKALYNGDVQKEWGFSSIDKDGTAHYPNNGYQFDNTFWSRPYEEESLTVLDYTKDARSGGKPRYYPAEGASQFFAYYVDDAGLDVNGAPLRDVNNVEDNTKATTISPSINWDNESAPSKISVKFCIDGSQDLMCGYATADYTVPSTGQQLKLKNFSAKSARAGVIPELGMEHLLTRFYFYLTGAGDPNVFGVDGKTSAVQVDSIKVLSQSKGTMMVACKNWEDYPAYDENIEWTGEERDSLALRESTGAPASLPEGKPNLRKFTPVNFKDREAEMWDKEHDIYYPIRVGEALLVEPNLAEYELFLYTSQTLNDYEGGPQVRKKERVSLKIKSDYIEKFKRGETYKVTIHVQSYREAKISIRLKAWEQGGDVEIGGDEWE